MFKIYEKYLIKNFLGKFFLISLIFLSLIIILSILEEISFFKDLETSFLFPYFLTLLGSPITLFEIFPFIFLLSTQFLFYDLFKKEQILILNYENLVNNFQKTMLSIQNFLGCKKENYPNKPKRITWAKEKREIQYDLVTKKFFIDTLKDDYRNFKEETGFKFKNFENV